MPGKTREKLEAECGNTAADRLLADAIDEVLDLVGAGQKKAEAMSRDHEMLKSEVWRMTGGLRDRFDEKCDVLDARLQKLEAAVSICNRCGEPFDPNMTSTSIDGTHANCDPTPAVRDPDKYIGWGRDPTPAVPIGTPEDVDPAFQGVKEYSFDSTHDCKDGFIGDDPPDLVFAPTPAVRDDPKYKWKPGTFRMQVPSVLDIAQRWAAKMKHDPDTEEWWFIQQACEEAIKMSSSDTTPSPASPDDLSDSINDAPNECPRCGAPRQDRDVQREPHEHTSMNAPPPTPAVNAIAERCDEDGEQKRPWKKIATRWLKMLPMSQYCQCDGQGLCSECRHHVDDLEKMCEEASAAVAKQGHEAWIECHRDRLNLRADRDRLADEAHHWRTKAECYGNMVHGCSPALEKAGFPVDSFGEGGAVRGIKDAVERLCADRDRLQAEVDAAKDCIAYVRECLGGKEILDEYKDLGADLRDDLREEVKSLRAEVDEAKAKSAMDERQCDEMTKEAGRLAEENARLQAEVERLEKRKCAICNDTGNLPDGVQAWDCPDHHPFECPFCPDKVNKMMEDLARLREREPVGEEELHTALGEVLEIAKTEIQRTDGGYFASVRDACIPILRRIARPGKVPSDGDVLRAADSCYKALDNDGLLSRCTGYGGMVISRIEKAIHALLTGTGGSDATD